MAKPSQPSDAKPRLYHALSSYYSMIARLALIEGGIAYQSVVIDIHLKMAQQQPDYVRLNPNMTVPTLVLPDRVLDESRDIATYALGVSDATLDRDTTAWLDLHYGYPIEQLTFGKLLARSPLARVMIPRRLEAVRRRLLKRATQNPELAKPYEARAAAFAERIHAFDPATVVRLAETRRAEAMGFMDRLEQTLRDGRTVLVPPTYGIADVVWTVFLARMEFVGMGGELQKRPALARYWRAMQARPSFAPADIWTKLHVIRLIGGMLGIG